MNVAQQKFAYVKPGTRRAGVCAAWARPFSSINHADADVCVTVGLMAGTIYLGPS